MTWADEEGRSTVGAGDVTFHKELGLGMSGRVYLGKVTRTNAFCCVKVMQKKRVLRLDQAENIMRERELMRSFDTPFVMQSRCSFQDGNHLYLVMDFMPGGDLFQFLVNGTGERIVPARRRAVLRGGGALALEYLPREASSIATSNPRTSCWTARDTSSSRTWASANPWRRANARTPRAAPAITWRRR